MAKWTCYFPRPWHGNKCLRTCNGKQLEAYCECGKAVRGAKVDSDCGWVGIVSSIDVLSTGIFVYAGIVVTGVGCMMLSPAATVINDSQRF